MLADLLSKLLEVAKTVMWLMLKHSIAMINGMHSSHGLECQLIELMNWNVLDSGMSDAEGNVRLNGSAGNLGDAVSRPSE
jgi:hypothetical protein